MMIEPQRSQRTKFEFYRELRVTWPGLVVPDNSNSFFADLARSIEDVSFAEGYSVVLCNSDLSDAKEKVYINVSNSV